MKQRMATSVLLLAALVVLGHKVAVHGQIKTDRASSAEGVAGDSPSSSPKSRTKAKEKSTPFPAERYARLLNSANEKIRQKGLAQLMRVHPDHPQAADVLIEAVTKALQSNNVTPGTREMIRVLGRFDQPQVVQNLLDWLPESVQSDPPADHAVDIILALGNFNRAEVHRALLPLLASKDYRIVMLATDVLGQQRSPDALQPIKGLAQRPEYLTRYGFRWSVLQAMCQYHTADAIDFLVGQLPSLDGQLKFAVVDYLSRLSQQSFGADTRQWAQWWQVARPSFQYEDAASSDVPNYLWDYPVPTFYDLKIYGKRIVFVIDNSSTMTQPVAGGRMTRLDLAKTELVQAIARLPVDAVFNIVVFDRSIHLLQPSSVMGKPDNKELAIHMVRYLQSGRGTAIFDGLDAAFRVDENAEVIYLLSDGLPSAGRVTAPDEIVRIVTEANRFRRITITAIAVGRRSELMIDLARQNNGSYRQSG